jgi:hypothetical protein
LIQVIAASDRFGQQSLVPRFFFHLREPSGRLIRDLEGVELPDIDAAMSEAAQAAVSLARGSERAGHDYSGWLFEIRSDRGSLYVAEFPSKTRLPDQPP